MDSHLPQDIVRWLAAEKLLKENAVIASSTHACGRKHRIRASLMPHIIMGISLRLDVPSLGKLGSPFE